MDEKITERPMFYDYFKTSADVLLAQYTRSKGQNASANLGYNRELFCDQFLKRVLPSRLGVDRGEIWDSLGNKTGQLELILTRDDSPRLTYDAGADTFLAEGVMGVIEVKSNLTRDKLTEALQTLKLVNCLQPKNTEFFSAGYSLDRPLRIIFSYEGATWRTLLEELIEPENNGIVDLVCILNRGVMFSRGLIMQWPEDKPFFIVNGKPASLAFLYRYLVAYGSSFLGRWIDLGPYFDPYNGWDNSE